MCSISTFQDSDKVSIKTQIIAEIEKQCVLHYKARNYFKENNKEFTKMNEISMNRMNMNLNSILAYE